MQLYDQILGQLKEAMKSKEEQRRDTLRLLQSAIKNEAIEKRQPPEELSDEQVVAVVKRMVKQRKDSIEQYRAGGREDLALKEVAELDLLSEYLPESLPPEELAKIVKEALAAQGITEKAKMGLAMGLAMKAVAGRASGEEVKALVEGLLQ